METALFLGLLAATFYSVVGIYKEPQPVPKSIDTQRALVFPTFAPLDLFDQVALLPDPLKIVSSLTKGRVLPSLRGDLKLGLWLSDDLLSPPVRVSVDFSVLNFASAAALASYIQTEIRAQFAGLANFTVVANIAGILVFTAGLSTLSPFNQVRFAFASIPGERDDQAQYFLNMLGLRQATIYDNAPGSLDLLTTYTGSNAAFLGLFSVQIEHTLGPGQFVVFSATRELVYQILATGSYSFYTDLTAPRFRLGSPNISVRATYLAVVANTVCQVTVSNSAPGPFVFQPASTFSSTTLGFSTPSSYTVPSNVVSISVEATGCGGTSKGFKTYGGAGATITGVVHTNASEVLPGDTIVMTPGTQAGERTVVRVLRGMTVIAEIIAAGGGDGGSDSIEASFAPHLATGGSASAFSGSPGFQAFTRVKVLDTEGRGGKKHVGGHAGKNATSLTAPGRPLFGGTHLDHPAGGDGVFGGGAGGAISFKGQKSFGGAGSGSSYATGFSNARATQALNILTRPESSKVHFPGTHGNGGSLSIPYGLGFVGLVVTTA
jgi:hypothetical protein